MSTIILSIGLGIGAFLITYLVKLIYPYFNIKSDNNIHIYYKNAYNNWYGEGKNLPTFTFDNFLQFYNLNPKEWQIMDTDGKVVLPGRKIGQKAYYGYEYDYQPIFFTNMFECKKYRDWAAEKVNEIKKEKDSENRNKATKTILNAVQEDINKIRKENIDIISQTENDLAANFKNLTVTEKQQFVTDDGKAIQQETYCGIASNGHHVRVIRQQQINQDGSLTDLGITFFESRKE